MKPFRPGEVMSSGTGILRQGQGLTTTARWDSCQCDTPKEVSVTRAGTAPPPSTHSAPNVTSALLQNRCAFCQQPRTT